MRKLVLFNMMTLDGFFEDSNRALDWHIVDEEFLNFAAQQLDCVDTIVLGRLTYQLMAAFWPTDRAMNTHPRIARSMNQTDKIVFSSTLDRAEWANTRLVKEKADAIIAELKKKPGKDIIIYGSAKLAASLAPSQLIDEYRIMLYPVVLGSGHPLFPGQARLRMKLLNTRAFRSGMVLLTYQPL